MLVTTLRTVTFIAPWRWCSSRTSASALVPSAARRSSSQRSSGVTVGSCSRSRCTSCTAKARGSGRLVEPTQQRLRARRLAPADSEQPIGEGVGFLTRRPAPDDSLGDASHVLDQHDAQRDRDRPQLADRERLHALVGTHETRRASAGRSGCRCARRRPRRVRTRADIPRAVRPRASAADGRSRAGGRRGSRGSALRRRGSCRPTTRPPA